MKHPLSINPKDSSILEAFGMSNAPKVNAFEAVFQTLPDGLGKHSWGAGYVFPAKLHGRPHNCGEEGCETTMTIELHMNVAAPIAEIRPKCLLCSVEADEENFESWCDGDPSGFFYPTKEVFLDWPVAQKVEWVDTYLAHQKGLGA